ncbi:calcium-activated potassium channel subunit beta-3 [Micropterus salmoides]|uniref:calcium-activated potassium channel subunit beta-3 n=1 Tax=Micropterus salmoides TaxID=27706 RepID=UPI0018EA4C0F|nr:calcium-activated potassium channel subunit beta-3 [Micropterus salmoides]
MFLNTAPRRSFSMPININLLGARRQQTRDFLHRGEKQERCKGVDDHGVQRAHTQIPVSSVGEDRVILLGFTMMAFSVLMFFVVGITMVKPCIDRNWEEKASCVLLNTEILEVDCRGVSTVPCLRVTVNLTASNQMVFLHFDEESVLLAPECFYIPKCQRDRTELLKEVEKVKTKLDAHQGNTSSCFTDRTRHPRVVILHKKYTCQEALFALQWPCLMVGGGALLVGLVKLTQHLAHLSSEMCSETAGGRLTSRHTQGKLYRLLQRSSMQSPS